MRTIVIGSGGRLGAAVSRHLRRCGHAVIAFDRKSLDLTRPEIISDRLEPLAFDACVVTAALTSLEYCEAHADEALAVNAAGPETVARICARRRARLIHVSTDYVYDGTRPGLRSENDPAVPLGHYASSKLEGERRILEATAGRALIVRTSWVFGPDRPAFPDTIIERAQRTDAVEAIADKMSIPTFSLDFARHIETFLADERLSGAGGHLNLCNLGAASWHDYARTTLDIAAELGLALRCRHVTPVTLASMTGFTARRPIHTAMSVERFRALTGDTPRPWQDALQEYLATYYVGKKNDAT
jgi:dTDP-4-dehydrorhamnose reductase